MNAVGGRPAGEGHAQRWQKNIAKIVFVANLHEFPDFPNALTVLFARSTQMTMDLHRLRAVEGTQVGTLVSASQKGSCDDDSSRASGNPASARKAICAKPYRNTRTIQHRAGDH